MLKIGITGGIGSGKSFICNIFNDLYKVPIYNSDNEAKKISNTNPVIISTLKKWYGEDIYLNNKVDRPKLASIIFNNEDELKKVNDLFHQFLEKDFLDWTKQYVNVPYVIFECAVLFENNLTDMIDYSISVSSIIPTRISRVIKRDNTTADRVIKRIRNQWTDNKKNKLSDYIIDNEDNKDLYGQIRNINKDFLILYEITNIL